MKAKTSRIDRRGLMRAGAWSGLALFGFAPAGMGFAASPEAKLDAREGKEAGLTKAEAAKFKPLAKGVMADSFAIVLPNGEKHIFRVSGGEKGPATVEIIGPGGATHSFTIKEGDSPAPILERQPTDVAKAATSNSFWQCFAGCMLGKIGAGAWNNLKNNWQSCWSQAQSKKYWYQKIAKFLACIFTLPYATYAVSCILRCR